MTISEVVRAIADRGLAYRGTAQLKDGGRYEGLNASSLVLVGFSGDKGWESFASSREWHEGGTDVLDRWSRRILKSIAHEVGAQPLFPFEGPPWWPFQSWALKAETVFPSPIGILIHPKWGLWHSWRGALAFQRPLEAPAPAPSVSPCEVCAEKSCLTACPVHAFAAAEYDVARCLGFLGEIDGKGCMTSGCKARRACPIGIEYRYHSEQARFHMNAFTEKQQQS